MAGFEDLADDIRDSSKRIHPSRPVVGVGAVVVSDDRVLVVRRAHEPLKGEWSLPGGAVELGESLRTAVVREVREETGLDVDVGPLVEVVDRVQRGPDGRVAYHFVVVDYLCRPRGETRPTSGSDADDVRWASVGELPELGVSPVAIDVVRKALRLARGA
jgi:ADP-ribose pyrophosphatase YjhB (NUDIX family)